MQIREANVADIPGILEVLKASLGEVSSKKSAKIWKYKHLDNPFGPSLVLIAEEMGKIIGVRAFMRWEWQIRLQKFQAFRAVDTATHPDHQGKGIFKKLTLRALELARERGDHFVFNTPNKNSRPGYLKMGWQEVNNIKVGITPTNPFYWNLQDIKYGSTFEHTHDVDSLLQKYNDSKKDLGKLFTPKFSSYLKWRYQENPMQEYMVRSDASFYIAAYLKRHYLFKEFRVVEKIVIDKEADRKADKMIKKWARETGAQIISQSGNSGLYSGGIGPGLTLKNINLKKAEEHSLIQLSNWDYSLGDLELF